MKLIHMKCVYTILVLPGNWCSLIIGSVIFTTSANHLLLNEVNIIQLLTFMEVNTVLY